MNQFGISPDDLPNASIEIIHALNDIRRKIFNKIIEIKGTDKVFIPDTYNFFPELFIDELNEGKYDVEELVSLSRALFYCERAVFMAAKNKDTKGIISLLLDAHYHFYRFDYHKKLVIEQKSELAHQSNTISNDCRKMAIDFYKENYEELKNKSANQIAELIINKKLFSDVKNKRTIADWIRNHRKNRENLQTALKIRLEDIVKIRQYSDN